MKLISRAHYDLLWDEITELRERLKSAAETLAERLSERDAYVARIEGLLKEEQLERRNLTTIMLEWQRHRIEAKPQVEAGPEPETWETIMRKQIDSLEKAEPE